MQSQIHDTVEDRDSNCQTTEQRVTTDNQTLTQESSFIFFFFFPLCAFVRKFNFEQFYILYEIAEN